MLRGASILVIDDEEMIQTLLKKILEIRGYRVTCASSAHAAEKLLAAQDFQLILLDLGLPDCGGAEFAAKVAKESLTPILVISGSPDLHTLDLPKTVVARACKPFDYSELLRSIERIGVSPDLGRTQQGII